MNRTRYRNNDPYWINARYSGSCSQCQAEIKKNARIFYYPANRAILCEECGEPAARQFEASKQDEAFYNSQ